jgi:hypothetical protein
MYINAIRYSSIGLVTGYGWITGVRFPEWASDFTLLHKVQTDSEALPASQLMEAEGTFPADKAAWREGND